MNHLRSLVALSLLLAVAVVPSAASAHVTLQPNEAPAGAFKRLDVRVPHERGDSSTRKIELRFPPGFVFVSYEPVPGWTATVKKVPLVPPVEVFGELQDEQFASITWRAIGLGIRPMQFQDFGLVLGLPDKPGTTLTFDALQTYADGEVVSWTGLPGSPRPAPTVKLLGAPTPAATDSGVAIRPLSGGGGLGDGGSGLIVGGLAMLTIGALAARRSRAAV